MKSDQKKVAGEISLSPNIFRFAVEQAATGIVIIKEGVVLYANPEACRIAGYDNPDEVKGTDVLGYIVKEDQEIVKSFILDVRESKKICFPVVFLKRGPERRTGP